MTEVCQNIPDPPKGCRRRYPWLFLLALGGGRTCQRATRSLLTAGWLLGLQVSMDYFLNVGR